MNLAFCGKKSYSRLGTGKLRAGYGKIGDRRQDAEYRRQKTGDRRQKEKSKSQNVKKSKEKKER
jgi:hypothetical protein